MWYPFIVLAILGSALLAGLRLGDELNETFTRSPGRTSFQLMGVVALWGCVSFGTRWFAGTELWGWRVAEAFAQTGKWYAFAAFVLCMLGVAVKQVENSEVRQLLLVVLELVIVTVTVQKTIPVYAWMPGVDYRDQQGHLRQTTDHTCGPVALGNLMEQWGIPAPSERELARRAGTTTEGTTVDGMIRAATLSGFQVKSCEIRTVDELKDLTLPAIVRISTLPGILHATTLTHFQDDRAYFVDPDYGTRSIPVDRFEQILTGKTLELIPRG